MNRDDPAQQNDRRKKRKTEIERSVLERYAGGAREKEDALCCPVDYDPRFLKVIADEILEKDYGCGDPSRFLKPGDTVLDLGSGGGKICYIASQVVGEKGRVIGVDFNPAMLALARKYRKETARKIGWDNVTFLRGKIQDLRTDWDRLEKELAKAPLSKAEDFMAFQESMAAESMRKPLIADESIDVVVSNCVLNLVRSEEKKELFGEMYRVLRRGGRVAISDIVSDEQVPQRLREDPELWSGCLSGAFQEAAFIRAFEEAGFYGIRIEKRDPAPWRTVEGIEFRSVTVTAWKGKEGECLERNQAVIYKGPWKKVEDDDRHVYRRGIRTAVCDKTFNILSREPYRDEFDYVPPRRNIPLSRAAPFDCRRDRERDPRETKGKGYKKTVVPDSSCSGEACC